MEGGEACKLARRFAPTRGRRGACICTHLGGGSLWGGYLHTHTLGVHLHARQACTQRDKRDNGPRSRSPRCTTTPLLSHGPFWGGGRGGVPALPPPQHSHMGTAPAPFPPFPSWMRLRPSLPSRCPLVVPLTSASCPVPPPPPFLPHIDTPPPPHSSPGHSVPFVPSLSPDPHVLCPHVPTLRPLGSHPPAPRLPHP